MRRASATERPIRFGVGSERPFTKNVNQKYVLPPNAMNSRTPNRRFPRQPRFIGRSLSECSSRLGPIALLGVTLDLALAVGAVLCLVVLAVVIASDQQRDQGLLPDVLHALGEDELQRRLR